MEVFVVADNFACLQVEVVLSRRWMMQVVSVFLPTSMLLCIGYSTLFVRVSLLQVGRCKRRSQSFIYLRPFS